MAAALELVRNGHPVRVVEERTERPPLSKALAVNPRTLELLEPSGVTDRLTQAGWRAREIQLHAPWIRTRIRIDRLPHPYNFMLVLPQNRTENILEERLMEAGVEVEKGKKLVDLNIESGTARVSLRVNEATSESCEASILFAADGAHSTVRRLLKMDFPGDSMDRPWRLIDADLDSPADPFRVHLYMDRKGPLFALRLENEVWRLISPRFDPRDILPPGWNIRSVQWESDFKVSHRLIASFRKGPVFFGGDAAHLHSPFGARGMNLGIEDAVTFARALHENRLDRYPAERWANADRIVKTVRRASRMAASGHPLLVAMRSHIAPALLKLRTPQNFLLRRVGGLE